jgi:phenol 2-monooxygenase
VAAGPDAYPLTVDLRHLRPDEANLGGGTEANGATSGLVGSNLNGQSWDSYVALKVSEGSTLETVRAKYVLGCDGAHSWVRSQAGIKMEGSSKESIW